MKLFKKKASSPPPAPEVCVDIDGNVYKTVKIAKQIWTAENLKTSRYCNGDAIPDVWSDQDWIKLESGARCIYDNDQNNTNIFGYLYNWHAVNDFRRIAPEGWRVPLDDDWKTLERYLGMNRIETDNTGWRGTNEGSRLAGNAQLWDDGALNEDPAFGASGFCALPAGNRSSEYGYFYDQGNDAYFWSAGEQDKDTAWYRDLDYYHSKINRSNSNKLHGFSVRLLKDCIV